MKQLSLLDLVAPPPPPPAPVAKPIEPLLPAEPVEPASMTELCELELVLHFDNVIRKELLVSKSGNEADAVWLRHADVEYAATGRSAPSTTRQGKPLANGLPVIAVNLPEALAREKGLM